ncbi:MAG: sulfurtransferase-like selenium metabolism protein YedF [Bacteroidales bacterium]
MITIDTRGTLCPQPLIMTRKAIRDANPGDELCILTDNEMACSNLRDYLTELNIEFVYTMQGECESFRLTIPQISQPEPNISDLCNIPASSNYVVVIKSESMGGGDEELGKLLMRAFINSLLETPALPSAIVLYNGGVHLALKNTDTVLSFKKLEEQGVRIMACGTCLEYYDVKSQLGVGMISNMYKITEVLTRAGHIIYP